MRALALVFGLAAVLLGGRPAAAEGLELQPVIGGSPMRCHDFRGVVVRTLKTTQLGDVGRASIIGRMPIISLDADRFGKLSSKMQIFFFMHECAHHTLGHVIRPTLDSERDADCWAANYGRWAGLFSRRDVEDFGPFFARSHGSRFGHLPGPQRHAYILNCFDRPESEPVMTMLKR
jgi:hypothetical protein